MHDRKDKRVQDNVWNDTVKLITYRNCRDDSVKDHGTDETFV